MVSACILLTYSFNVALLKDFYSSEVFTPASFGKHEIKFDSKILFHDNNMTAVIVGLVAARLSFLI